MRWTRVVAALLILWAAYFVWPYFALYSLANAVRTRDAAAINRRIDFPRLRRSLTEQVTRIYLKSTGREARLGQFREVAIAASSSIADPIIARLISADTLIELLGSGWPTEVLPEKIPEMKGLRSGSIGNAWQIFVNSDHGIRTFSLAIPADVSAPFQFVLHFRLSAWKWRLYDIELPEQLAVRLTQELIRKDKK